MGGDKKVRLYNFMLPIWAFFFWPSWLWLILIPVNYLIDRLVLSWSLGKMADKKVFLRKHTWKICLAGFAADVGGAVILFCIFMLGGTGEEGSSLSEFIGDLIYKVGFNPFGSLLSFAIVAAAVFLAAAIIYFLDRAILKKAGLDKKQAKGSALRLALITAPYLYFFPSALLYEGSLLKTCMGRFL